MARSTSLGELWFELLLSQAEFQFIAHFYSLQNKIYLPYFAIPLIQTDIDKLLANYEFKLAVSVSMPSIAIMGMRLCTVTLPQSPIINHRNLSSIHSPAP